jgi:hypothetical protein
MLDRHPAAFETAAARPPLAEEFSGCHQEQTPGAVTRGALAERVSKHVRHPYGLALPSFCASAIASPALFPGMTRK